MKDWLPVSYLRNLLESDFVPISMIVELIKSEYDNYLKNNKIRFKISVFSEA